MSTLAFIADVIGSLAWPAATVIAVLLLREHVPFFIASLKRMKLPGIELELRRAREGVIEASSWTHVQTSALAAATQTPVELIEASFSELTTAARSALRGVQTDVDVLSFTELMQRCRQFGSIGNRVADAGQLLQTMRGAALQGGNWAASTGDAAEFLLLSRALMDLLLQLNPQH